MNDVPADDRLSGRVPTQPSDPRPSAAAALVVLHAIALYGARTAESIALGAAWDVAGTLVVLERLAVEGLVIEAPFVDGIRAWVLSPTLSAQLARAGSPT